MGFFGPPFEKHWSTELIWKFALWMIPFIGVAYIGEHFFGSEFVKVLIFGFLLTLFWMRNNEYQTGIRR